MLVSGGKISEGDPTHQSTFDIAMLSNIPSLTYLAPTTKEELTAMMHWALRQNIGPVAIRVPGNGVHSAELNNFDVHKMNIVHNGNQVAILGVGSLLPLAETVREQLKADNIDATVVDPRDVSDLDTETLSNLEEDHQLVVTLEEASLSGGFGEKVDRFYSPTNMNVLNFGAKKRFNDRETTKELLGEYKLTPEQIINEIKDNF